MKPVYNLIFVRNRLLDHCWKLIAVTIAAQILTAPLCLYHFHQFPNLFLFTNLLAVPLSSLILFGEILLIAFAWFTPAAELMGWCLFQCIRFLNQFIELAGNVPFAVWQGLQISTTQVFLLYAFIACFSTWCFQKNKPALISSLAALLLFAAIRTNSFWTAMHQQKLIIYNVPKLQAIDFIAGRKYFFKGDSPIVRDPNLQNFHLTPSRILHRVSKSDSLDQLSALGNSIQFGNKLVVFIDRPLHKPASQKIKTDIIVLSKNAAVDIATLLNSFECRQVVIDGSNSLRKTERWKKDCAKAGIRCHAVNGEGAFVLNLH